MPDTTARPVVSGVEVHPSGAHRFTSFPLGRKWSVDDSGHLHVNAEDGSLVATYARCEWSSVRLADPE